MIDVKTVADFLIYLSTICIAILAIGGFLRVVVVRPVINKLRTELAPVQAEISSDGGSMKDQITKMTIKLDTLEQRFTDHLRSHNKLEN